MKILIQKNANRFKYLISKILALVLLICIFNCQKDDDAYTESYNEVVNIKEYTFNELNSNEKFTSSFNKVVDGIKKNGLVQGRNGMNNDFEIDSTIIKEIKIGNTTSYTFSAYLDNQEPNSFTI